MSFSQVSHVDNVSVPCIPWYFPTPVNVPVYFCNPWETVRFLEFMHNVPEGQCHCLPDCNATFYEPDITSALLRKCDSSNFGVSWLCNANNRLEPLDKEITILLTKILLCSKFFLKSQPLFK